MVTMTDFSVGVQPFSVENREVSLSGKRVAVFLDREDCFDEVGVLKRETWKEVLPLLVDAAETHLFDARLTPMEVHSFAVQHRTEGVRRIVVETGLDIIFMDKSKLIAEQWNTPFNLRFWFSEFDGLFRAPESPLHPPGIMPESPGKQHP